VTGSLIVTAELYVDTGERTRYGQQWIRPPTATFDCWRCFHHDEVSGAGGIPGFVAGVRQAHRKVCPSVAAHPGAA
jgi:hypothetical protein